MGNKNKKPDLYDISIEMKMNARMMEKQAQKLETGERAERKKILDAMAKGRTEDARVYAETVIR